MGLTRTIGVLLGALFFAVLLWSYVHLSQPYEADVDLPLAISPPKGLAVQSNIPERLHARVRGAGWQILVMDFTKSSRFDVNLAERDVRPEQPKLLLRQDDLTHSVIIPSDVRLVKVEPDSLELSFGQVTRRRVPIRADLDITAGSGYTVVGGPQLVPAFVTVEGSPSIVDSLKSFPTKRIREHNLHEALVTSIELSDTLQNMLTLVSPQRATLRVDVQALGEKTFVVPVLVDAVPPEKEVLLIPGSVSVTLRGGVEALSKLKGEDVRAHVMYESVHFDTARSVKPIVDLPQGIRYLTSEPERLRFVIRKRLAARAPGETSQSPASQHEATGGGVNAH